MPLPIRSPLKSALLVMTAPLPSSPRVVPLADEMTIGRLGYGYQGVPVRVIDPMVSAGQHARIRTTASGVSVEDMGSSNTTELNGRRVRSAQLHVGDVIRVGDSHLRFEHQLDGEPWVAQAKPLLEAVLAAPADDAPRRVLADWLSERGDPRGEFISCQLSTRRNAERRAAQLLRKHELQWLAPLVCPVEQWTFARGFLDTVVAREVVAAQVLRRHHPLSAIHPLS